MTTRCPETQPHAGHDWFTEDTIYCQGSPHPRTFDLVRFHDVSGVSGEGIVAQGVQFTDGQVALQWPQPGRSVAVWDSVDALLSIHGHNGLTVVRFHDGDD